MRRRMRDRRVTKRERKVKTTPPYSKASLRRWRDAQSALAAGRRFGGVTEVDAEEDASNAGAVVADWSCCLARTSPGAR